MDTLPKDLINLVHSYTHLREDVVLGFENDQNNLDLKWFLYKRYRGLPCGYELVDLVKRKGRPLLEYFKANPGYIECENSYIFTEVLKLAFYNRMKYMDTLCLKYAITKNVNHINSFDYSKEVIKYDEYQEVAIMPHNKPEPVIDNIVYENFEHDIIISAYKNGSDIAISRIQELLDNYDSLFGRGLIKAIAT